MSTFTQIYYHIVYSTKSRHQVLFEDLRERLFHYIWGILKKNDCCLYRINAMDDHVHMLTSLHPTIALANLIRDIKTSTTGWIRNDIGIRDFPGWQIGYGAFTKSHNEKAAITHYIASQDKHHKKMSFQEELRKLLESEGVIFDEKYLL